MSNKTRKDLAKADRRLTAVLLNPPSRPEFWNGPFQSILDNYGEAVEADARDNLTAYHLAQGEKDA